MTEFEFWVELITFYLYFLTVFVLSAATSSLSFIVVGKPNSKHTSDSTGHQQSTLPLQQPLLFKMCIVICVTSKLS